MFDMILDDIESKSGIGHHRRELGHQIVFGHHRKRCQLRFGEMGGVDSSQPLSVKRRMSNRPCEQVAKSLLSFRLES
jgi:hypothetical protein